MGKKWGKKCSNKPQTHQKSLPKQDLTIRFYKTVVEHKLFAISIVFESVTH